MDNPFAERSSVEQVEEGTELAPKFDERGLIPVMTVDHPTGTPLMHAYMNAEALKRTIETGEAHYYSRSRNKLWKKGESSGLVQKVQRLLVDDDQDCVWMEVEVAGSGASCHVGYRSCFYRQIPVGDDAASAAGPLKLSYIERDKIFDPKDVYGDAPNPTQL